MASAVGWMRRTACCASPAQELGEELKQAREELEEEGQRRLSEQRALENDLRHEQAEVERLQEAEEEARQARKAYGDELQDARAEVERQQRLLLERQDLGEELRAAQAEAAEAAAQAERQRSRLLEERSEEVGGALSPRGREEPGGVSELEAARHSGEMARLRAELEERERGLREELRRAEARAASLEVAAEERQRAAGDGRAASAAEEESGGRLRAASAAEEAAALRAAQLEGELQGAKAAQAEREAKLAAAARELGALKQVRGQSRPLRVELLQRISAGARRDLGEQEGRIAKLLAAHSERAGAGEGGRSEALRSLLRQSEVAMEGLRSDLGDPALQRIRLAAGDPQRLLADRLPYLGPKALRQRLDSLAHAPPRAPP